jgi:Family of unknown function (DUF6502)
MASSREKNSRKSLKRRVRAVLGPPTDRRLIVDLLKEMHHIVLDTAVELGVSATDRRRALALAGKDKKRPRPSLSTIQPTYRLAGILARWRFDKRYLRPDGSPRVLSIKGKGATFETLARPFVPTLPVEKVVKMICENAEVTRLKGDKIALIGSPVMISPKTPEITVASLIFRFRRLAETTVHNAAIPANVKGTGRFERLVTGVLTDKEFRVFSQSVRQQLQDLCDRVDAGMKQPGPRSKGRAKKGKSCGIGLYVFRDDGRDG